MRQQWKQLIPSQLCLVSWRQWGQCQGSAVSQQSNGHVSVTVTGLLAASFAHAASTPRNVAQITTFKDGRSSSCTRERPFVWKPTRYDWITNLFLRLLLISRSVFSRNTETMVLYFGYLFDILISFSSIPGSEQARLYFIIN